jgi:hypothetical protein
MPKISAPMSSDNGRMSKVQGADVLPAEAASVIAMSEIPFFEAAPC